MNLKPCLRYVATLLVGAALCVPLVTMAAKPTPTADDVLADRVLKKIESSGALDRAIERYVQRQREQQQKTADADQQQRMARVLFARKVDPAQDRIWGSENAKVSIIVYSDIECPFCKRFGGIPERVADRFPGQVNVVWRHFPLEMHGVNARKEAIAAECVARQAGSKAFFAFIDQMLQQTRGNGQGLEQGDPGILELAARFGAKDVEALKTCLTNGEANTVVENDIKDGMSAGITGTPGVLVRDNLSGKTAFVGGAIAEEALQEEVRKLLTETQGGK